MCKCYFFANDVSIFSVVRDTKKSANNMTKVLETIGHKWGNQWKMSFNPAKEAAFSRRLISAAKEVVFLDPIWITVIRPMMKLIIIPFMKKIHFFKKRNLNPFNKTLALL